MTAPSLESRIRGVGSSNLLVLGATVGILMVIIPLGVLIGMVVLGNAGGSGDSGGLAVLALCFAGGVYVVVDVLRQGGRAQVLADFARAHGLTLVRASVAPHYAGSLFRDESHAVLHSVRTGQQAFVEVGDRFPTRGPRNRPRQPKLFLRARLAGRPTQAPQEGLIPPDLHQALERFAGPCAIEVSGDELTVFGTRKLDVGRLERVREALALTAALVACVDATVTPAGVVAGPTRSGIPIPVLPGPPPPAADRAPGPLAAVGWSLALLIGAPLAFAVVMSILDDVLPRTEAAAQLVVSLLVLVMTAVIGRMVLRLLRPSAPRRRRRRPVSTRRPVQDDHRPSRLVP